MARRPVWHAAVIGAVIVAMAGCGSDGSFDGTTAGESTDLAVMHDTAEGLPADIDQFRFAILDADEQQVFDCLHARRDVHRFGVPTTGSFLQVEYLRGGEIIATSVIPIGLAPDEETHVRVVGDPTSPVHLVNVSQRTDTDGGAGGRGAVSFSQSAGRWHVMIDGTATFLKGVGFDYTQVADTSGGPRSTDWFSYIDPDIASAGANSIRTYGFAWNVITGTCVGSGDPCACVPNALCNWCSGNEQCNGPVTDQAMAQGQATLISALLKFAADHSTTQNFITVLAGFVWDQGQGDMTSLTTKAVEILYTDPNFKHVLGWIVGNEVAGGFYSQLNDTIQAVKNTMTSSQRTRPVMTAVPTVSTGQVSVIQSQLPALDWLGINNFYGAYDPTHEGGGFLNVQADDLHDGGWIKPWAITEYYSYDLPSLSMPNQEFDTAGCTISCMSNGPCEGSTCQFGKCSVPCRYYLELNSTLNAANYANSYSQYIASVDAKDKGSVGGYVLNWGPPHNSKLVAFWKEVYAYKGAFKPFVNPPWTGGASFDRLAVADAVATLYGGSLSANAPPQIVLPPDGDRQGIDCTFKATLTVNPQPVARNTALTASVTATDTDPLTFDWYLIGGTAQGFSGDINAPQKNPQDFTNTTTMHFGNGSTTTTGNTYKNDLTFMLPSAATPGNNYQLRVLVRDGQGGAATAVIGFRTQ